MGIDKEALKYSRICKGAKRSWSVCEDGTVISTTLKHYVEKTLKPYLKRGKATVKINNKEQTLKNLVAAHFIEGYTKGDYVEVIDGNPFNCAAWNLRIYSQSEHGKRTGHRSRSQKVTANGVEYRSVRQCAKAVNASYQTVLDYMAGRINHSVLRGIDIAKAK